MPVLRLPWQLQDGLSNYAAHHECRYHRADVVQPGHRRTRKGHLAREIDALGGEMGKSHRHDRTAIQDAEHEERSGGLGSKSTVRQKGLPVPAEMGLRIRTQSRFKTRTNQLKSCTRMAWRLGLKLHLKSNTSETVVITTGTFLRGLMHVGSTQQPGGRAGDLAATGLSVSLKEIGLELGRLKTGTPPRLLKRSIDFSKNGSPTRR